VVCTAPDVLFVTAPDVWCVTAPDVLWVTYGVLVHSSGAAMSNIYLPTQTVQLTFYASRPRIDLRF